MKVDMQQKHFFRLVSPIVNGAQLRLVFLQGGSLIIECVKEGKPTWAHLMNPTMKAHPRSVFIDELPLSGKEEKKEENKEEESPSK